MPTYTYECVKCKHTFERVKRITDDSEEKCPKCGVKAKRLISTGAGIIFKGKGFYRTDYKKGSPDKPEKPCESGTCPGNTGCPLNKD